MKNSIKGFSIGGATIISIFIILSLSMFGVLSVSTTQANLRLSNRYTDNIKAYYEANGKIQETLYNINQELKTQGFSTYDNNITTQINEHQIISLTWHADEKNNVVIDEYKTIPLGDGDYNIIQDELWDGTFEEDIN